MKRMRKCEVVRSAKEQIDIYSRCADPESHLAINVAKEALDFLARTKRKVFTVEEANALLDW